MGKLLSLILFFLLFICGYAQKTKLVIKKEKGQITEKYYVLKSDKNVLHGEYISYHKLTSDDYKKYGDKIKEHGFYKFGKKDSLWIEYYGPYNKQRNQYGVKIFLKDVKTKGNYVNDNKVGIWISKKNEIIERYDFDHHKKLMPIIAVIPKFSDDIQNAGYIGNVTVKYKMNKECTIEILEISNPFSSEIEQTIKETLQKQEELMKKYCNKDCECSDVVNTMNVNFVGKD